MDDDSIETQKIIKQLQNNLKKLNQAAKNLEKNAIDCKNFCEGLKSSLGAVQDAAQRRESRK